MADTIFSKIINGEIPADIVYEDGQVVAFRDVDPKAPVHILIVPREQIPTINDLTPEHALLVGHMVLTAKKLATDEGLDTGYRLVMNCNEAGGQTVFHLHMHLLGGRNMKWPPG
jgi:histidine triad (HIT) family protein